jgi:heme/copper-type cytochrome/quinol oxidase subunit 3
MTLLACAMGALLVAVVLGLWLSSIYILMEHPPAGMVASLIHGTFGAAVVALVFAALHRPVTSGPNAGNPASNFAWTAFYTLALALAGGVTIASLHIARRKISPLLIAMHATLGIAGAVILCAYWISPASYGR